MSELAPVVTARNLTLTREAFANAREQRSILAEFVREVMVDGVDFGKIPGTDKPTLLKPGAEKLVELFQTSPSYTLEDKIEDWTGGLFYYRFSCHITRGEFVVAQGVGSANTFESRYRWRNGSKVCPKCGKEAIIRGKEEWGGGWLCWKSKGGCNAKFSIDDRSIVDQKTEKIDNPDKFDCANTVLKMAKKRALVDAAIALGRCSDLFNQDVEDIAENDHYASERQSGRNSRPAEDNRQDAKPEQRKESQSTQTTQATQASQSNGQPEKKPEKTIEQRLDACVEKIKATSSIPDLIKLREHAETVFKEKSHLEKMGFAYSTQFAALAIASIESSLTVEKVDEIYAHAKELLHKYPSQLDSIRLRALAKNDALSSVEDPAHSSANDEPNDFNF